MHKEKLKFIISKIIIINTKIIFIKYILVEKYAEERISGVIDDKATNLLSLNTILNNGIVMKYPRTQKLIMKYAYIIKF